MDEDDDADDDKSGADDVTDERAVLDVEALKHDFIYSGLSLNCIGEGHGVTGATVHNYAKRGNWKRIVPVVRRPNRTKKLKPKLPVQRSRVEIMADRLYRLLDQKVTIMERRIALASAPDAPTQSAADADRDMRGLSMIARLYAKVVELDERIQKSKSRDAAETESGVPANADELRRDLARRLERLNRTGDAG